MMSTVYTSPHMFVLPVPVPVPVVVVPQYPRPQPCPYSVYNDLIPNHPKTLRMIGWCPPPQGWLKINTDGAYKTSLDLGTAGGLIRDSKGKWRGGFAMNVGAATNALEMEFLAILCGLSLAWKLGFRRIILESDCKNAIDYLIEERNDRDDVLLQKIKSLLGRSWVVQVQHEYREANQAADWLANLGVELPTGCHEWEAPPSSRLFSIMRQDISGVKFPRMCAS